MNYATPEHGTKKGNIIIKVPKPVAINHADSVKSIIRPKLKIGAPNDKYEQEADRVADQVMNMSEPIKSSLPGTSSQLDRTISPKSISPLKCNTCLENKNLIQKKENETTEVFPATDSNIQSIEGSGKPLSRSERSFFESRFGEDFSDVRIHNDSRATSITRSINARAFTLGQNVVFGTGEYSLDSATGKKLLAHELTHVVQQRDTKKDSSVEDLTQKAIIQRQEIDVDSLQQQVPNLFSSVRLTSSKDDMTSILIMRTKSILSSHLTSRSQQAVNQFHTDLSVSSGGNILLDIVTKIGTLIPIPQVQLASNVFEIATKVYELLPESLTDPSSVRLSLPSFLQAARLSISLRTNEIQNGNDFIFENITDAVQSIPETGYTERLSMLIDFATALNSYPSYQIQQQELIKSWINSSEDSLDFGSAAGQIYFNIYYHREDQSWHSTRIRSEDTQLFPMISQLITNAILDDGEAHFDDIARPEGVKNALISAYGGNTSLNRLPFPFNLNIEERVDHEERVSNGIGGFNNETQSSFTSYIYSKGSQGNFEFNGFTFRKDRGDQLLRLFLRSGRMPKVNDLTNET